jgi:hypothetical protein
MRKAITILAALGLLVLGSGCASRAPYDYSNFKAHPPKSIVVLPPTNQSPDVKATYGYLSTMTMPIAEKGYYVYPVAVVDEYMKENGLPSATEMQSVPLQKIQEVFGADAVLYTNVTQYGTRYAVLDSITEVSATGKLVDVRSGVTLWDGSVKIAQGMNGGSGGNPIAALIAKAIVSIVNQILANSTDYAHQVSAIANAQLVNEKDHGLLDGPYLAVR